MLFVTLINFLWTFVHFFMCEVPWKGAFGLIFVLFFLSFLSISFFFFISLHLWWILHVFFFFLNIFTSNDLIMVFSFLILFQLWLDLQNSIKHGVSCAMLNDLNVKNIDHNDDTWTVWLRCVFGSGVSAHHFGQIAIRIHPTSICMVFHLQRKTKWQRIHEWKSKKN